ncbi:MAG TPA: GNAT family N-acetyltransferase [Gemmatimonadaceae bacterium]|nr:GNAT family N-acetyltransferase [Gemmatimonadaceae bacterium]
MEVSFRRLDPSDAAAYKVIRLEGLRDAPRAFLSTVEEEAALTLEAYRARLSTVDNATIGAFSANELVGIGTILRETRTRNRHKGDIVGMYVTPSARGAGVASGIMERLIAHARSLGLRSIRLDVESENSGARRLYERFAFKPYGHEPRAHLLDGAWLEVILMVLLLD